MKFLALTLILLMIVALTLAKFQTVPHVEGKCPSVTFVENFDLDKFMGKWYSLKESKEGIPCITYDLTKIDENFFRVYREPQNVTSTARTVRRNSFSDGFVFDSPHPVYNGAVLKVFATDYENYAGGLVCKEVEGGKQVQVLAYWGRKTTLSEEHFAAMDSVIGKYKKVDKKQLKNNKYENCEDLRSGVETQ